MSPSMCGSLIKTGLSSMAVLVVDCEQMADLDVTGAEEIISLNEELQAADVEMWLVRLHGDALGIAQKAGVTDAIGEENIMPTIRLAGQRLRSRTSPEEGPPPDGTPDDRPD